MINITSTNNTITVTTPDTSRENANRIKAMIESIIKSEVVLLVKAYSTISFRIGGLNDINN